jgi:hypothetical protein
MPKVLKMAKPKPKTKTKAKSKVPNVTKAPKTKTKMKTTTLMMPGLKSFRELWELSVDRSLLGQQT